MIFLLSSFSPAIHLHPGPLPLAIQVIFSPRLLVIGSFQAPDSSLRFPPLKISSRTPHRRSGP